ncbi:cytochrome c oxidase assembly protein [Sphingomonas rhizophila]|uniref:cytochrome c oxidase assembly protein n=1 Tax=Sphingomonas rhizophila TaxID=2071607 RepID=UPI001FEBE81F|nr:cytochrome c oxidase assembly protein [Sphingomonas rhizophila]
MLVTTVQMGLLGALITFAANPLYAPHFSVTAPWGLSPLEDQQMAGLIMWAPSAGLYLAAALWTAARWFEREERGAAT